MGAPKGLNRFIDKWLYAASGSMFSFAVYHAANDSLWFMLLNLCMAVASWKLADWKPSGWE